MQMIGWGQTAFRRQHLQELVSHGFLSPSEYDELIDCRNFLWQVRFALHTLGPAAAKTCCCSITSAGSPSSSATGIRRKKPGGRATMQRYYRTVNALSRLNEMLLQLFEEAILLADEPGEPQPINRRFQVRRGYLEVTQTNVFLRYPFALLEIFLVLQQHRKSGLRASTIRLIGPPPLIDDKFRNDVRPRSLFMEILRQPHGVTRCNCG